MAKLNCSGLSAKRPDGSGFGVGPPITLLNVNG
jgi:hypothetical protein